jgi:hypothetical protein
VGVRGWGGKFGERREGRKKAAGRMGEGGQLEVSHSMGKLFCWGVRGTLI